MCHLRTNSVMKKSGQQKDMVKQAGDTQIKLLYIAFLVTSSIQHTRNELSYFQI